MRLAWKWLLGTGEVSIGPDGEWNHLTFDEIMSIPEDAGGQAVTPNGDGKTEVPATLAIPKLKKLPKLRPRIFVGEETIWKTLTGHSIDYKRVPNLEWKCLVVIGSAKEDGILQGDLNRATGQDKRSVPKRTDFLAQKGYIAKRTHMVRGMKTSKLWLTKFAPALPVPSNPLGGKDLSRVSLTRDMQPVAWHQQWTGKDKEGRPEIHYMALGQTIIAITKAWGTLRIRDLKAKLGILGKKWQMKVMSRFLRRFHKLGNITYVAATFVGDKHVFKDCVRFARDPTESDWRLLLATGKKTSRYTNQGKDKQPRVKSKAKGSKGRGKKAPNPAKPAVKILRKKPKLRLGAIATGWVPEKPLANTVADFVLTGGARGYSTPEISTDTVGYVFRRHMFTHLINLSNGEVQPPGLREYQMSKEMVKSGNTKQYMFSVAGGLKVKPADEIQEQVTIDPALWQNDGGGVQKPANQSIEDAFGFGSVNAKVFAENGSSHLTHLSRMDPGKQPKPRRHYGGRRSKTYATLQSAQTTDEVNKADAELPDSHEDDKVDVRASQPHVRRGRPPNKAKDQSNDGEAEDSPATRPSRKRKVSQRASYLESFELDTDNPETVDDVSATNGQPRPKRRVVMTARVSQEYENDEPRMESEDDPEEESEKEQGRSQPGVYIGKPGSLNPEPHRRGRPRKSLVLIFRSDKIKNPNYLPGWMDYPKPTPAPHQSEVSRAPRKSPTRPPLTVDAGAPGFHHTKSVKQAVGQVPDATIDPSEPAASSSQNQRSTQTAAEDCEGSIVVQSIGSGEQGQEGQQGLNNDLAVYSTSSAAVKPLPATGAPTKAERQPRKPKLDKYVCEKCGGTWKNDIGLKYHLEKAKVPCNPFYAENPELMVKAKSVRASRARFGTPEPRVEAASPDVSGKSSISLSPSPRTPRSARVLKKKNLLVPRFVDHSDPANHRTVLRQRSALRKSESGFSGAPGPRGLKGSEAVAKDGATTTQTATEEAIAATAEASAATVVASDHAITNNLEEAELDDDLPYLAHIRAENTALQPEHSAFHFLEPGSQSRALERNTDAAQESSEAQTTEQPSRLTLTNMSLAYSEPFAPTNDVSVSFEAYPVGALEETTQDATSGNMDFTAESHGAAPEFPAVSSSSAQFGARVRKPLPVQRPAVPADTETTPLQEDWQQSEAIQGRMPPFRLPLTDFKARTAKEVRSHKIEEIVRYLLANNDGVFPSGRALFYSVLKVYIREWPDLPLPTTVGVTKVVNRLQRQAEIKEMSSAYKSPTERIWTTLAMITLSHIDPNGFVAGDLKKKMKAAQPDVYIPPAFAPDESEKAHFKTLDVLPAQRGKGPGRRDHKLEEEIVTFNAPFYLKKGLAGVRPRNRQRTLQSEDEDSNAGDGDSEAAETASPSRRRGRKRAAEGPSTEAPAVKKTRRGRKPRNTISFEAAGDHLPLRSIRPHKFSIDESHATNPGLESLPPSFFSGTAAAPTSSYTAPSKLQFLEPNTRLEEEDEPELELENVDANSTEDLSHEYEKSFLHAVGESSFKSTIELESASKCVWPGIPLQWFEANDSSFTMKGWFPHARELLKDSLPQSMEQMAYKITSHCKTDKWADPAYGQFVTSVDGCMSWELSDQGHRSMSGTIAPDYVFICFTPSPAVSNMAPCTLEWRESNNWTLDSIPYESLVGNEEEAAKSAENAELYGITFNPERARRGPGRPRKYPPSVRDGPPRKYVRKQQKDNSVRELKLQRELTAYPRDSSEYFRPKGQEDPDVDWKAEDTRIAAYVSVSTLLGGINKAMDWGVMMRIFPDSKLSNLRKFWATIKKEREGFIQNLTAKFQEDFLEAYESGDLPPIDFDNALEYDWPRLVKWTLALVVREGIDLPPNMPQFDEELELVPVERGEFDWRDSYYHWQRSVFNKFQDAAAEPASTVLDKQPKTEDLDSAIARSWVRALCCTDSDEYTPLSIKKKFLALARDGQRTEREVSDLLEQTIRDLEHRRISIKQKSQALATGRPYKLNEHFLRTLDRFSNEDKFSVAAGFKAKMDEAFLKGEAVEIPWRTEDGMVIAAFNLQAHGRVRIEPIKKLDVPFGFKPGFYESRKFPKSYYRFDLQVTPTSRYVYNEDVDILWKATDDAVIPGAAEDGRLPMWCDFFGKPDRLRWFKMLSAVLFVLACRGAMTDEFAAQALRPCIETFEVEMIRKWALKMGIVREITEGCGAVSVSEWWWLICGLPVIEASESKDGGHDQYSGWHKRRWRGQYRVH